jgi:hypothetical protein
MRAKKSLLIAVSAWLILLIISFWASIHMGWGPAESAHDPASIWMYVRRGLLFGCALLLPLLAGGKGAEAYGWNISLKWLMIALPIGVAMGFVNPGGFDPRYVPAILLACMHALATELFFRAYLINTLSAYFKKFWPPVIISSLMYGIFYLTVSTTWQQPGARKLIFVGLFTLIGMLHGYCYKKSRSFFAPWIIHFLGVLKYKLLF